MANLITKSLKRKILFLVITVTLIPVVFVGIISFDSAKNTIQQESLSKLESIADLKVQRIEQFFNSMKLDIEIARENPAVKENLPTLSKFVDDRLHPDYVKARQMTNSQLLHLQNVKDWIVDVMLVNPEGRIVYVTNLEHEIQDLGNQLPDPDGKSFEEGKSEVYLTDIFQNPLENLELGMLLTAPIYDANDEFIGVIVFELNMDVIYNFIQETTGLGKTGETLIGKKMENYAVFINPLRHDSDAAFKRKVHLEDDIALPIREAVQGIEGSGITVDYRPEPIIAVWRYIPSLDWGLVAKIDTAEAFASIDTLRSTVIIIASISVAIVLILGIVTAKSISQPILKLRNIAKEVEKGNLDVSLNIKGTDEISQLSEAFNSMSKSLKESNKRVTDLLKALDESSLVAITDKEGIITYANKKFEVVSKYPKGELLGKNHRILKSGYHPPEFFADLWKTISSGHVWYGDIKNKAKDGSHYWVKTIIMPILDKHGKPEQYIAIRTDITNQKDIEVKLDNALNELKKTDVLKDEFSSMITHELKTPLFPIIGYCKMLKKADMIGHLNEEQLKAVETIERNANGLEILINDILDINKLEIDKLKFVIKEFSLDEFITNLDSSNKSIIEQKGIEFVINSNNIQGVVIKSDKNRLRQVFDNLINNSAKFVNEHGGKIEISAKKEDQQILFYVKDNGIGIPKDKQKDLFKKFYQVDTSLERSEGSGLGLVICKAITKKLGGKIWVESQEGKGSTFYFTISTNIVRKR